jgi:Domain of unknown function (DUF1833)
MSRTLSPAAIASLTAENTDEVWIVLLTIDHPSLAEPIRVANNNEDITSNGEDYIGLPFSIELPGEDADEPGTAAIQVPNVDREIVAAARGIQGRASATIEVVLASQPNVVEVGFYGLEMTEVEWDASTVRGRLRFEQIMTEPLSPIITPERFPGLF